MQGTFAVINNSVQKIPQIQSTTVLLFKILISADSYSKKKTGMILMNCHSFNEHLFGIFSALVIFFLETQAEAMNVFSIDNFTRTS